MFLMREVPLYPAGVRNPLGPYLRPMPRVLGGSWGGGRFLMGKVPWQGFKENLKVDEDGDEADEFFEVTDEGLRQRSVR